MRRLIDGGLCFNYQVLHPCDRPKMRELGERLCDAAMGEFESGWFEEVRYLVGQLMVRVREDLDASGADEVTWRLIALADRRYGADGIAAMAYAEIKLGDAGRLGVASA